MAIVLYFSLFIGTVHSEKDNPSVSLRAFSFLKFAYRHGQYFLIEVENDCNSTTACLQSGYLFSVQRQFPWRSCVAFSATKRLHSLMQLGKKSTPQSVPTVDYRFQFPPRNQPRKVSLVYLHLIIYPAFDND